MDHDSGDGDPVRSVFADDPEMRELVELFVQEMPARVGALRASWQAQQIAEIERIAHQLKGASSGYGFDVIGDAAARLESPLKGGADDLESIRNQFEQLIDLCSRAVV